MTRIVIVGLCFLVTVYAWTNEQLLETVAKACPAENYMCPKKAFGLFDKDDWAWDTAAIISSPAAEDFRRARHLNEGTLIAIRKNFCCLEGPCLYRCGIAPKIEIDLIKAYPSNTAKILGLNLPELEKHRDFISKWIKKENVPNLRQDQPAEVEEFFDDVFAHQDKIRERLQASQ